MANPLFTSLPAPKVPRNNFPITHNNKLTLTTQKLVPTWLKEGLPGDINRIFLECMARAQPLVCPVFQSYTISHHCFWVPMRTLHKHWQDFLYGGKNGDYAGVMPYTTLADIYSFVNICYSNLQGSSTVESLSNMKELAYCLKNFDYMGLPFVCQSTAGPNEIPEEGAVEDTCFGLFVGAWLDNEWNIVLKDNDYDPVDLLPFLASLKVWSEYYRDENLQEDPMDAVSGSGADIDLSEVVGYVDISVAGPEWFVTLFQLRPRAWKKDRFTSALPFAQRGPEVLIPIAGTVPVSNVLAGTDPSGALEVSGLIAGKKMVQNADTYEKLSTLGEVDFENAELTTTIEQFRDAERLQRWYENNARGGYRSNEAQPAHWGVYTKDATLQRAVFLGGIRQPLVISEVDQNSATTAESPQGNLAGKGTSYNNGRLFKQFADENGFTLVFTSILQNADYFQGLPKIFTRKERTEYAWPEFANLGEEAVYTRELYAAAPKDEVFGYTPRYSDYKSVPSEVHGDMRSSLQHWAVPRVFADKPALNEEFIFNEPQKLAFAVESGMVDEFVMVMRFSGKSSRLLPFYGVPTI